MNPREVSPDTRVSDRREFLKTSAAVGAAVTLPSFTMRAAANKNSNLRIFHIGVGGIGGMQRGNLKYRKNFVLRILTGADVNVS